MNRRFAHGALAMAVLVGAGVVFANSVGAAAPRQIPASPISTWSSPAFSVSSPDDSTVFVTTGGTAEVKRID